SQGNEPIDTAVLQEALEAVRAVAAPVLAVVRGNLSEMAGILVQAADLTLVAHDVVLPVQIMASADGQDGQYQSIHETLTGEQALRLGLVNWSVPVQHIDTEMERILDMLREKSAVALRLVKASVRLGAAQQAAKGQEDAAARLAALEQI